MQLTAVVLMTRTLVQGTEPRTMEMLAATAPRKLPEAAHRQGMPCHVTRGGGGRGADGVVCCSVLWHGVKRCVCALTACSADTTTSAHAPPLPPRPCLYLWR